MKTCLSDEEVRELFYPPSQAKLWWNKLGKWQALAIILTMVISFIALHVTGDKGKASVITTIAFAATIAFATTTTITTTACVAATIVPFVASSFSFTVFVSDIAIIFTSIFFLVATSLVNFSATEEMEGCYGIRKGVTWLSFAVEFMVVLLFLILLAC